jgi:hypothetical protein
MNKQQADTIGFLNRDKLTLLRQQWCALLWNVMARTGNGYRRHSLRHTGRGDDKRTKKVGYGEGLIKSFTQKNLTRRANGERQVAG